MYEAFHDCTPNQHDLAISMGCRHIHLAVRLHLFIVDDDWWSLGYGPPRDVLMTKQSRTFLHLTSSRSLRRTLVSGRYMDYSPPPSNRLTSAATLRYLLASLIYTVECKRTLESLSSCVAKMERWTEVVSRVRRPPLMIPRPT